MTQSHWTDCDLSKFAISPTLGALSIQLTNNYNGETLATLECTGLLSVRISSGLALDGSLLPAFVGNVQAEKLESSTASECIKSHNYGFSKVGSKLPFQPFFVWRISIGGGEIEAEILVRECKIT